MLAERAGDLHGLDAGTHGLAAPIIEKFAGPGGRAVLPELLEGLLEKVSPDALQVIPKQVAQAEALLGLRTERPSPREVRAEPRSGVRPRSIPAGFVGQSRGQATGRPVIGSDRRPRIIVDSGAAQARGLREFV